MQKKCDLFIGSGLSYESKMISWDDLLKPMAKNININMNILGDEEDLPLIAQYIVNENSGNKNIIYGNIVKEFNKISTINRHHRVLMNMEINTIWTTNYDCLLEKCFAEKTPTVIKNNRDLANPKESSRMEIIKIHGSADGDMGDIVLTKQDYDEFLFNKGAIVNKLEEAFINHSILFLGYGYRDSNIRNVMIKASMLTSKYTQKHYIVLLDVKKKKNEDKEKFNERKRRNQLWIKELNRIGIQELVVKDANELNEILLEIERKSRGKSIFVSGSHNEKDKALYKKFGNALSEIEDIIFVNGQNEGTGIRVLTSFMEGALEKKKELKDIIRFFPNPYAANKNYSNDPKLISRLKLERKPLFSSTKVFVVFKGGMGTRAEYEIAKESGCIILPAITDTKDYSNDLLKDIVKDADVINVLKNRVPKYCNIILRKKVPTVEDLIKATGDLING